MLKMTESVDALEKNRMKTFAKTWSNVLFSDFIAFRVSMHKLQVKICCKGLSFNLFSASEGI